MLSSKNISIRNKLIFTQVIISVLVLSVFFIAFIVSDIRDYKERKVDSITSIAHVIGINSISALDFQDKESADDNLAALKNIAPEITYARISDKDGKIFASYSRFGNSVQHVIHPLNGKKAEFSDKQLFVTDDIISNEKVVGKVSLDVDLAELEAIKKAKYGIAAILLLVAIAFCFVIALVVQPYISRRLLYLVNTMQEVRKTGNYNLTITDDGKDEISTLIQGFNKFMLEVKESQHRKDEFIGIASHELKTPLTSIKGYLDLLKAIEDKEPNRQFVQKGLESVYKLERLIKDLLDVSKIQSGQLQLDIKPFNIDELINDTIASVQMVTVTHTIKRTDELSRQIIDGDSQRIEQVLINLLSNAIKYSPGEDNVLVSASVKNDQLVIRVRDFGIGIPADESEEIFGRFYRTKEMSVHISGFGLGLYICRDIISRHHGKIWMEKEIKGSSFYFSLPLSAEQNNQLQENIVN